MNKETFLANSPMPREIVESAVSQNFPLVLFIAGNDPKTEWSDWRGLMWGWHRGFVIIIGVS